MRFLNLNLGFSEEIQPRMARRATDEEDKRFHPACLELSKPKPFPANETKSVILPALQKFPLTDQVTDPLSDQVAALLRTNYLAPALEAALIERTIPENPNSRLQKYRLTEKGRKLLS